MRVALRVSRSKLKGRLYVTPMPYGPYDVHNRAMEYIRKYNISHVVILLTDEEIEKMEKGT